MRQKQGKTTLHRESGYVHPDKLKPLLYTDVETKAGCLLLVACATHDKWTDLYECDPRTNPQDLTRTDLEQEDFMDMTFVRRLGNQETHVRTIITRHGETRLFVQHLNIMSRH